MPNATIDQILALLGQASKTGSNMASEHVPPTSHPVGKIDDGTMAPPSDSERLKQQDSYMKDQTPAPVATASPPTLSAEATSPQLGVEQGTSDSKELATLSDVLDCCTEDPGTSHPAKAASLSNGQLVKTGAALIESLDADMTFMIAAAKNDLLNAQTNQPKTAAASGPTSFSTTATPHSQASLSDPKVAAQAEVEFITGVIRYAEEQAVKTALYLVRHKQAEEHEEHEEEEESEEYSEGGESQGSSESAEAQTPPPAANYVEVPPEMLEDGAPPMFEGGRMSDDMGGRMSDDMGGMPAGDGMPSEEELMALMALLQQEGIDPAQLGMLAQEKAAAANAAYEARRADFIANRLTNLNNKIAAAKATTPAGKKAAQSARRYLDELLSNVVSN